ncbi:MAG: hypothetical protein QOI73_1717, partial [Solirubrobacteraceae bacterium]|nr:hypothetical protein [Solirubrobacteraceae bacterium]
MVSADPLLLGGLADGLPAFEADYLRALKMFRVAQQAAIDTPESKDTLDALKAAQETVKAYEPVSQYLRDLTLHEHMRRRFNHAIIT